MTSPKWEKNFQMVEISTKFIFVCVFVLKKLWLSMNPLPFLSMYRVQ